MIGYNTLYKSMNGIKVVSDGISFISEGIAQHEDIIYNNTIMSNDSKTILKNNNIKTETIECNSINTDSLITTDIEADNIQTKYFKVLDSLDKNIFLVDGLLNDMIYSYKQFNFNEKLYIVDKDIHQVQTGKIYQQGTGENQLKDTYVNGYLKVGSNITQTGGSSSLGALTVDTITQNAGKGITQSGDVSNTFGGTSQMKNLIITDSIVFPSTVEVPAVTTSDDILMNGNAVITQEVSTLTTKFNNFRNTRTLNLTIDGDITQIKGLGTVSLKNTTIGGTTTLQGDITQTAGATELKTIRCNNITLNDNQIITMSGTGYITQSGTGTNTLKTINMISNANINQTGGIISQTLGGVNALSHFRSLGFGIIAGKNGATHYANAHNVFGLQFQYGRTTDNHCYIMSNRNTGGNGAIRFQRYVGSIYLDEPLVIGDDITVNKNLSIPGGSISCSSATLGIISQDELNSLENMNYNIKDKFQSLDDQISNITSTSSNNNLALTGITYTSSSDTTTIDNNLKVNKDTSLLNLNVSNTTITKYLSILDSMSFKDIGHPTDTNRFYQNYLAFDNSVFNNKCKNGRLTFYATNNDGLEKELFKISTSGIYVSNTDFYINNTNILSTLNTNTNNINNLLTATTGISYNSTNDTTTIDNNLTVNKTLSVQGLDVKAEIDAIKATYTSGTINTTDLIASNITTNNLTVNNNTTLKTTNIITSFGNGTSSASLNIANGNNSIIFIPNSASGAYNSTVLQGDNSIVGMNDALNISCWSNTKNGVRITDTSTTLTGNTNFINVNDTNGNINLNNVLTVKNDSAIITNTTITNLTTTNINNSNLITSNDISTNNLTVNNNIYSDGDIVYRRGIRYDKSFRIEGNITLTLPLYRSYIFNAPDFVGTNNSEIVQITYVATLPTITTHDYDGITFQFVATGRNHLLQIKAPVNNYIYNTVGTTVEYLELKLDKLEYIKLIIQDRNYFILETKSRDNTCGYLCDGLHQGRNVFYPLLCSVIFLDPDNAGNAIIVHPGYKIVLYQGVDFLGASETFDNSNGFSPQYYEIVANDTHTSAKIYYKGVEIKHRNLSYY